MRPEKRRSAQSLLKCLPAVGDFWHCQGYRRPRTVIPMEAIVTIASYAAMICPVALIGLLWRWAKRADKVETETLMPTRGSPERRQK